MAATSGRARTWFEDSSPDDVLESFNSGQKSSTPPSRLLSTHLICCVFEYVCSQSILLHPTCHSSIFHPNFFFHPLLLAPLFPRRIFPISTSLAQSEGPSFLLHVFCWLLIFHSVSSWGEAVLRLLRASKSTFLQGEHVHHRISQI